MTRGSRSYYVKHGKIALFVFAGLMFLSIVIIANLQGGEKGGRLVFSGADATEEDEPRMINPRYYGTDSKNRPFSINAKNAVQKKNGDVLLEDINGDMLLNEKSWLALNATQGQIDKDAKEIVLSGEVSMFYEGGYEFRSSYAKIYPDSAQAEGNQPIQGQGPSGTLKADSFNVTDRGQTLYFKGNVNVKLYLK